MKDHSMLRYFSIWDRVSISCSYDILNRKTTFVIRLISLCQAFLSVFANLAFQTRQQDFWFKPHVEWLYNLFGAVRFIGLLSEPISCLILLFIILLYLLLLISAVLRLVFLSYETRNLKLNISKYNQFCSGLFLIHSEILLYPTSVGLTALLEIFVHSEVVTNFPSAAGIVLIVISLLLNVFIGILYILFCYSPIKLKPMISRKSSIHLLGLAALKLLLPLLQCNVLRETEGNQLVWEIVSVVFAFLVTLGLLTYSRTLLPEYDLGIMKLHIVFDSMSIILVVSQIFTLIIKDQGLLLNIVCLISPLWIYLCLNTYNNALTQIACYPEKITNLNHLLHLKIIHNQLEDSIMHDKNKRVYPSRAPEAHWFRNHGFNNETPNSHTQRFRDKSNDFLNEQYEKLSDVKVINNMGTLAYIKSILKHGLYPKSYSVCMRLLSRKPSIPYKISALVILNRIERNIQNQVTKNNSEGSFFNIIWQDSLAEAALTELKNGLANFTKEALSFWRELQTDKPDLMALVSEAKKIESQRCKLESLWKLEMHKLSTTGYSIAHLLYGTFQSIYMPWDAMQHIDKYRQLVGAKHLHHGGMTINSSNSESVTIMISSDKKSLGQVLSCSQSVSKIFGIEKSALIGSNVNLLMPQFFKERHDQFLWNFYETGKTKVIWKQSQVIAKDVNHNIFPINIYLAIQPTLDKGIVYSALIRRVEEQKEYILFAKDGIIQDISAGIQALFNIQPYSRIHITNICPECTEDYISIVTSDEVENLPEDLEAASNLSGSKAKQSAVFKYSQGNILESIRYWISIKTISYGDDFLRIMTLKPYNKVENRSRVKLLGTEFPEETTYEISNIDIPPEEVDEKINQTDNICDTKRISVSEKDDNLTSRRSLIKKTINPFQSKRLATRLISELPSDLQSHQDEDQIKVIVSTHGSAETSLSHSVEKTADRIQKMHQNPLPSTFRRMFKILFILVLFASVGMTGIKYVAFQDSIHDISLAVDVMRTSYQRLIALCWLWRYSINYKGIFDGIITQNVDAMQRYKMVIQYNQNLIKTANNQLATYIATGTQEQQQIFFARNIEFEYVDDTSYSLQPETLNSFEAINLFVEKISAFNMVSAGDLLASQNAELEFVRKNAANDILIVSENLIEVFATALYQESDQKKSLLEILLITSIIVGCFAIVLVIYHNFFDYMKTMKKVARTLLAIHPKTITKIISDLDSMKTAFSDLNKQIPKRLHLLYSKNIHQLAKSESHIALSREYTSRKLLLAKSLRSFILILLICSFFLIGILELILSLDVINELLVIGHRLIIIPKAWYSCTLVLATMLETVMALNSTYVRNEPIYEQLKENINLLIPNDDLFDTFTDKKGTFIDSEIEYIFKTDPCPFIVNLPGINLQSACKTGTYNETIGDFAVNSMFAAELNAMTRDLYNDTLNLQKAIAYNSKIGLTISPRANTLISSYSYINNLMVKRFTEAVRSGLHQGLVRLVYETVFMVLIGVVSVWFLNVRVLDDSDLRVLLKAIPAEQVLRNKLINNFIKDLYRGNDAVRNIKIDFN